MRTDIWKQPRGNHTIDQIKRGHCSQPCRGRQNLIPKPSIPIQRLKHTIAQEGDSRILRIPIEHLLICQLLEHGDLWAPSPLKFFQPFGGIIPIVQTTWQEIGQRHGIDHSLHASLRSMGIHRVGGIADQHRSIRHPGWCSYPPSRHIRGLPPIVQAAKEPRELWRNLAPYLL